MTEEDRNRRIVALLAEEARAPQRWHYLSFASQEDGFLGVCWVRAGGFLTAIQIARQYGINPGGEVRGTALPFLREPPEDSAYKLHRDRAEIDRLCQAWDALENS